MSLDSDKSFRLRPPSGVRDKPALLQLQDRLAVDRNGLKHKEFFPYTVDVGLVCGYGCVHAF